MKILFIIVWIVLWSYGSYSMGLFFVENKNITISQKVSATKQISEPVILQKQEETEVIEEKLEEITDINTIFPAVETGEIKDLEVFKREFSIEGENYFVLRKFLQNDKEKYLFLQDKTYATSVVLASSIDELSEYGVLYETSEYKKHQDEVYSRGSTESNSLQNNGIVSNPDTNEVFLTADFCPSSKHGFEKKILETFIEQGHKNIWIAITSAWIKGHSNDYKWLIEKNNSQQLHISWINHTKTHNYSNGTHFSRNFILTPGLDLEDELLTVEEDLLKEWQVPSIFMRYPGLVSDNNTRKETIYTYWLFPLGSDAWLAKWETPDHGSIILIHGNKNEHYGIQLMNKVLEKNDFEYWAIENILK